jgi:DNA-binding FadR family transcriptional regulator
MGREVANIHLGSGAEAKRAIGDDLEKRDRKWLRKAALAMVDSVRDDWRQWRKATLN